MSPFSQHRPKKDIWLTIPDSEDELDRYLDQLLQDGTAKAMREEEIARAREDKKRSAGGNRVGGRRVNPYLDPTVQDKLAKYEMKPRRTPLQHAEPLSPRSS